MNSVFVRFGPFLPINSQLTMRRSVALKKSDPSKALSFKPKSVFFDYNFKDVITYALGVGAQPKTDLHFLFEKHAQFQVLPTFAFYPGLISFYPLESSTPGVETLKTHILHAEQTLRIFAPIPSDGRFRSEWKVSEVLDKGKASLVKREVTTWNDLTGEKLAEGTYTMFHLGTGGFGGAKKSALNMEEVTTPQRVPDKVVEEKTYPNQPAIYRLGSGDLNEMHISPGFGAALGEPDPILHGLCTLGFAVRTVLKEYGNNDARSFKEVKARFTSPVLPGQTLLIEMWNSGDRVYFVVKVKENGKVAINNAFVDLIQTYEKLAKL